MKITKDLINKLSLNFLPSTENYTQLDKLKELYIPFPHEESILKANHSLRIEGERGTGKSMILTILESESKNEEDKMIVNYINIEQDRPYEVSNLPKASDAIIIDFWNIFLLYHVVAKWLDTNVDIYINTSNLPKRFIDLIPTREINKENALIVPIIDNIYDLYTKRKNLLDNSLESYRKELSTIYSEPGFLRDVLYEFKKRIYKKKDNFLYVDHQFHILIDEYDTLVYKLQKGLNSIVLNRLSGVNFKIAYRPKGITMDTFGTRTIQMDDIPYFSPRIIFEKFSTRYQKFFTSLADSRIISISNELPSVKQLFGVSISFTKLADLLRDGKNKDDLSLEDKKLFEIAFPSRGRINYFGYNTIAVLSSGIIRNYLGLVIEIIRQSTPIDTSKIPINPTKQASIIRRFSEQKFIETMKEIKVDREKYKDFIYKMGNYFERRISTNLKLNGIGSFRIVNPSKLSAEGENFLNTLQKHSCFQVSDIRKSKDGSSLEPVYHINKIFAPLFNIIPLSRDAVGIDACEIDLFLDNSKEFDKILDNKISRYDRLANIHDKTKKSDKTKKQTSLSDYF